MERNGKDINNIFYLHEKVGKMTKTQSNTQTLQLMDTIVFDC